MTKKERFILFRTSPYRPLFEGGLGFRSPPSRLEYSRMSAKNKKLVRLWEFSNYTLADNLRRAMNKLNHSDPVFVGRAPRTIYLQPSLAKKKAISKELESLA